MMIDVGIGSVQDNMVDTYDDNVDLKDYTTIDIFLTNVQIVKTKLEERKKQIELFIKLMREALDKLFGKNFEHVYNTRYYECDEFTYQLEKELTIPNVGQFKFFYGNVDTPIIRSEFDDKLNFLKDGIVLINNTGRYTRLNFNKNSELIIHDYIYNEKDNTFVLNLTKDRLLTIEDLMYSLSALFNTAKVELPI